MRRRDRFAHVRTGWRARLGWQLRCWADRIDHANAPRIMHLSFTFEDHRGIVIHDDGRGCPLVYLGETHYGWAHEDSGQPGGWDRHGGQRRERMSR